MTTISSARCAAVLPFPKALGAERPSKAERERRVYPAAPKVDRGPVHRHSQTRSFPEGIWWWLNTTSHHHAMRGSEIAFCRHHDTVGVFVDTHPLSSHPKRMGPRDA